ncbi:hypothetical protein, partial [Alistipes communis]|uniref:hypothetical protein n=1 Tax=Alistipes communis TaxID=2585118 RepID=UPI003FD6D235
VGFHTGESNSSVVHFLSSCAFVLIQKHQKIKHGESNGRRHLRSLSGHKRLRFYGVILCAASTAAARQSPQAASAFAC